MNLRKFVKLDDGGFHSGIFSSYLLVVFEMKFYSLVQGTRYLNLALKDVVFVVIRNIVKQVLKFETLETGEKKNQKVYFYLSKRHLKILV